MQSPGMALPRSALPGVRRALPSLLLLLLALQLLACPGALGRIRRASDLYKTRREEFETPRNVLARDAVVAATPDPRPDQLKTFKSLKGSFKTSATNVVLLLVGDKFDPCTRLVLEDVFQMLDNVTIFGKNKPLYSKDTSSTKFNSNCSPTVNAWWGTVRSYLRTKTVNNKKVTEQVTDKIFFYGTYTYSALEVDGEFTKGVINSLKKRLINPVPSQGFNSFSKPADFKDMVVVTLLGAGVKFPLLGENQKLKSKFTCATGFVKSPGYFPDFYGGIVVPTNANGDLWDPTCQILPNPPSGYTLTTSNKCLQADHLTSHILARLADLHVNPTQFMYKTGTLKPVAKNAPTWVCSAGLLSTGKKYKDTAQVPCSAGSVCDLRGLRSSKITTNTKGKYIYAYLSSKAGTAEKISWATSNWGIDFKPTKTSKYPIVSFYNVVSSKYLHYVQPYRALTGKCVMGAGEPNPNTCIVPKVL